MTTSTLRLTKAELADLSRRRGDRVVNFFQKRLFLTNAWKSPFLLRDWQKERYRKLYGTLRPDGRRQYTRGFIAEGSKNGKSEEMSGLAAYHLYPEGDGVYGAEVYSAASSRGQSSIIYKNLKRMLKQSPKLYVGGKRTRFYDTEKKVYVPETEAVFQALSADADFNDGINPTFVIADELHRHKNREMWDMLRKKMGTRYEPLIISITTAGDDKTHFLYEEWEYAAQVQDGLLQNDRLYVDIRTVPMDLDWTDEKNWYLANPALGDFLDLEEFRAQAKEAQEKPSEESSFRRLSLNQWTTKASAWFKHGQWESCGGETLGAIEKRCAGQKCFAGVDLSSTSDFTAVAYLFPRDDGGFDVLMRFFLPEVSLEGRKEKRHQLRAWNKAGLLDVTPGDCIDDEHIRNVIERDAEKYEIVELGYDPWKALDLVNRLAEAGMTVVPVRQGAITLTPPCQKLEVLVTKKLLHHGGHPVLRWQADNVVLLKKNDGTMKPDKNKSTEKIDGVAAILTAMERAMAPRDAKGYAGVVAV